MDRISKIIHRISLAGIGLEIGPSHNPIIPKSTGHQVETVDHLDRQGLIAKYQGHGVDLSKIEEVDYVWSGQPLSELTQKASYYDWVIASHVIEHVPDIISFIRECSAILKPGGTLSLVVPDRRYCFDYLRWPSSTGAVIQAHRDKRQVHSSGQVFDHFSTATKLDENIAWQAGANGKLAFVHDMDYAKMQFRKSIASSEYVDIHGWVFTPASFRLMINDLNQLDLISLEESFFSESVGCEFYLSYCNKPTTHLHDRLVLAKQAFAEVLEAEVSGEKPLGLR